MKSGWAVVLGVLFGLLGAGAVFLASSPPRGRPIELLPPPTPIPLHVHISGEVISPGVYTLPINSRLEAAIQAAGGFTENALQDGLNLAQPLQDGDKIEIPSMEIARTTSSAETDLTIERQPQAESTALININTASQTELESLPGIGPITAEKIIAYRQENGPFTAIEEIQKVSGIGPATFERIQTLITIEQSP